jgi:hypothetical protein
MRDRLKRLLGVNGACSPYLESIGELLAKLISGKEFVLRDSFDQGGYSCRTRQQHLAWAAKKL